MSDKRLLIIVGHGLYNPWLNILYEGQCKTWLTWSHSERIEIVHCHGTPVNKFGLLLDRIHERARWKNRWTALAQRWIDRALALPFRNYIPPVTKSNYLNLEQNCYHIRIPDTYFTQSWQNLAWFKHFLESAKYDFLFSTTTSSLLKPNQLLEIVDKLDANQPIYGGFKPYQGATFAAGNNRLLSKAAIELIIKNRAHLDFGLIEDVGIGTLLSKLNIPLTDLPSLHISATDEIATADKAGLITSNFHIRVKSGPLNQRNDVFLMNEVFNRINEHEEKI